MNGVDLCVVCGETVDPEYNCTVHFDDCTLDDQQVCDCYGYAHPDCCPECKQETGAV